MSKMCINCIHYEVCIYKSKPSDPKPMQESQAKECKHYVEK